jgi:hypothetical protein
LPSTVAPLSLSKVVSRSVLRFVFAPVRKSFSERSRPARERTCVE